MWLYKQCELFESINTVEIQGRNLRSFLLPACCESEKGACEKGACEKGAWAFPAVKKLFVLAGLGI